MKLFLLIFFSLSTLFGADATELKPFTNVTYKKLNEISGIIKSKKYPNIYWAHNDSGDKPNIYAFDITKKINKKNIKKIKVKGADAKDWEEIAYYGDSILIGDFGNNLNKRKDLCIYMINEPDPYKDEKIKVIKKINFKFPDQKEFPPKIRSFDIEAMYTKGKKIYILTKHRDDTMSNLYILNSTDKKMNLLEKISTFDAKDMVTAADINKDSNKVAVLTYTGIWLFENFKGENIFNGERYFTELKKRQYEAIAFDRDSLVFTTENGKVFKIKLSTIRNIDKY
jgi:hypothetical protein